MKSEDYIAVVILKFSLHLKFKEFPLTVLSTVTIRYAHYVTSDIVKTLNA